MAGMRFPIVFLVDRLFVPCRHDYGHRFGNARAASTSFALGPGGFSSRSKTRKLGQPHMIRLLDDGLGGAQSVTHHKIRQVGVVKRHRVQEERFILGPNPLGVAATLHNDVRIQIVHQGQAGLNFVGLGGAARVPS